jgi:hypothetical protein
MTNLRAIAATVTLFGLLGPAIGGAIAFASRPEDLRLMAGLAYSFGIVPATIAGAIYGSIRVRAPQPPRWHARLLWGAAAGLIGCVAMFLLVGAIDLVIVRDSPGYRYFDPGRLRQLIVPGVPAGAICALLMGRRSTTAPTPRR